ncbi:cysteine protease ATG4a isoform X1 [Brassica napus]|uniref:cysteine protease ATG4a isoform X1 n=2 Tax=Brassica napus TaxID=3708 RepID=UPI002078D41F|nr:cysteine protease ATG4a isoform X1 [Brassica napus]
MKALTDRFVPQQRSPSPPTPLVSSDSEHSDNKCTLWSTSSSVSQPYREPSTTSGRKQLCAATWTSFVKKVSMASGAIKRFQDRVLGPNRTGLPSTTSDFWLLGVCYKLSEDEETDDGSVVAALKQDFSSRILMTYRKGFEPIKDTSYSSDVNWGCMIRSSQMLFAQALLFHRLGRSWRNKNSEVSSVQPEQEYLETLEPFGDSEASAFSIHNLILVGETYGLAAGSWVGPYAICRSWESLACKKRKQSDSLPMAIHIVSGSEDGERGGAPVLCIEDVIKSCVEFSRGEDEWAPLLLLVPLVLGLDRVNPRYIPSLKATFTFPQSLGVLGGKPGASTYIVGVQEDNGFYLDPHDVQQVVTVNKETLDVVDTSSYHCNVLRYVPLESLDPSLALGFYCRDKADFDDLCHRASTLAEESKGAPLFTVTQTHSLVNHHSSCEFVEDREEEHGEEDDWQLL